MLPFAARDRPQRDRALLLQAGSKGTVKERAWKYRGVRTDRYTLVRWKVPKLRELYDRRRDPWERTNLWDDPRYAEVRDRLERLLDTLEPCAGEACRPTVPRLPRPGR